MTTTTTTTATTINTITNQIRHPPRHFIIAIFVWIIIRYHQSLLQYLLRLLKKTSRNNDDDRLRRAKESFRVSRSRFHNIQQRKKLRKRHRKHDKIKNKMNRGDLLMVQSCRPPPSSGDDDESDDDGFGVVTIVGIDCEMVGVGRHGQESELARCSIVQRIVTTSSSSSSSSEQTSFQLAENKFRILYDKAVRPRRKVVDYRTAYSGITKDILNGEGNLVVVGHEECRREVAELLASVDGRPVVVVGHALDNDFDALRIKHPTALIRDTATYPPFMREGRRKNRPLQRKLSHLLSEELSLDIQSSNKGHSSVEDAAAALSLYLKHRERWEDSLGNPLKLMIVGGEEDGEGRRSSSYPPLTLLLDGCNLPLSVRFHDDNKNNNNQRTANGTTTSDSSLEQQQQPPRILSKINPHGTSPPNNNGTNTTHYFDWLPVFRSLLWNASPAIHDIRLIFDGKKYQQTHATSPKKRQRHPPPGTSTLLSPQISLEITPPTLSADDVIISHVTTLTPSPSPPPSSTTPADMLRRYATTHDHHPDALPAYHVVRRGPTNAGSKKYATFLNKLLLSRGHGEGGYCLCGLTTGLVAEGRRVAGMLERRGLGGDGGGKRKEEGRVVICEERRREGVRCVVVTEDVYLRQRVVDAGGVVLTYKQLGCLG